MRRQFLIMLLVFATAASQIAANSAYSGESPKVSQEQSAQKFHGQHMTLKQQQALEMLGPDVSVQFDGQDVPFSLMGSLSPRLHKDDPVADAEAAVETFGQVFRRRRHDGFTYSNISQDKAGITYVEMAQTYKGVPVAGGKLLVWLSQDEVTGITSSFIADLKLDTLPALTNDDVVTIARSRIHEEGLQADTLETGEPVIFVNDANVGHLVIPARATYREAPTSKSEEFLVDAQNGIILDRHPFEQKKEGDADMKVAGCCFPPNLLANPGFDLAPIGTGWTVRSMTSFTTCPDIPLSSDSVWPASTGDIIFPGKPTHSDGYKAWLGGWGFKRQDYVSQTITLPAYNPFSGPTRATLSLWITISTAEIMQRPGFPSGTGSPDYMFVEIFDPVSSTWKILGYYTSFYTSGPFINQSASINSYLGKTVKIRFRSCEDEAFQTSFFVDDVAVTVQ